MATASTGSVSVDSDLLICWCPRSKPANTTDIGLLAQTGLGHHPARGPALSSRWA